MTHFLAIGDKCIAFDGQDARKRSQLFAKRIDNGPYEGPLVLRERIQWFGPKRGFYSRFTKLDLSDV